MGVWDKESLKTLLTYTQVLYNVCIHNVYVLYLRRYCMTIAILAMCVATAWPISVVVINTLRKVTK